jgi:hypothetical protein
LRLALASVLLLVCVMRVQADGIHAALLPAVVAVAPDSEFTLELTITAADASFNGLDSVVEFDPAALTFVPAAPVSLQEGALMTGACGNTFHRFAAAADSLNLTDVLLCAGESLTGPGAVYRLRFRAGATPGTTFVRLRPPRTRFYNAGLYVLPVETFDAEIRIGSLVGVQPGAGHSARVIPNPARAGSAIRLEGFPAGRLSIYDARGRFVRGLDSVSWDGRDMRGVLAPAGRYTIVAGGVTRPVTLLH